MISRVSVVSDEINKQEFQKFIDAGGYFEFSPNCWDFIQYDSVIEIENNNIYGSDGPDYCFAFTMDEIVWKDMYMLSTDEEERLDIASQIEDFLKTKGINTGKLVLTLL